jgi:D-alanyl-D-alanine carboxypeptidase/D-alanyl-D-alanine-endopeptidase (penicillin-binding protein 4)
MRSRCRLVAAFLSIAPLAAACTSAPGLTAPDGGGLAAAANGPSPLAGERPRRCAAPRRVFDPTVVRKHYQERIAKVAGRHSMGVVVGISGTILFALGGDRPRVPASNEKLLLSMALFDTLGPDYRIPTGAASASGVSGGVIDGDLWVIGHGDPTLTDHQPGYWGGVRSTTLAGLAAAVKRAGVHEIDGSVMAGNGYFSHDLDAPGWPSFVPHSYVEPVTSLVVNGNNTVRHKPEKRVASVLTRELKKVGVAVRGAPGAGDPPRGLTHVATERSVPLSSIVRFMDRTSNNFFAEMLGKLLGAETFGPPGTIRKGARAIEAWVRAHGGRAVAHDSSGLSSADRVAPETIVHLLGEAEGRRWVGELRRGLPAPGEGTLRWRLPGLKVRAKTGTLFAGASALSGWVRSHGRWVEFSILDDHTPKTVEDRIVRILSQTHLDAPRTPPVRCSPRG